MERVDKLRQGDRESWNHLLVKDPDLADTRVRAVSWEDVPGSPEMTRYTLVIENCPEPISFISKQTNLAEARFYREILPRIPSLAPRCWFSYFDNEQSWIIVEEAFADFPAIQWDASDVERVVNALANLHVKFWGGAGFLEAIGWELTIGHPEPVELTQLSQELPRIESWNRGRDALPSEHALRISGSLREKFIEAAVGLQLLTELGGWPGVIDESGIVAIAELLDDPWPILYPLRQLPGTFLHGNPTPDYWRISLLDEYRLLSWKQAGIGPGIYDLISFIEQYGLIREAGLLKARKNWPLSEETIIDTYILNLGSQLGPRFNARANRQAIPAARCLYMLTTWLPRFTKWVGNIPPDRTLWREINLLSDEELREAGFTEMVAFRPIAAQVFERFMLAYRSL